MSSERLIESRTSVRQALWEARMKSPTAALEEVLRRTEVAAGRAQSNTAGGSETRAPIVRLQSPSGRFDLFLCEFHFVCLGVSLFGVL